MINKVKKTNLLELKADHPHYRVTIEDLDKNEIIYQVESFAGVVASMETQPEIKRELVNQGIEDIAVVAKMQKLAWGHPLLALTCLDQLKEAIRPQLGKIREFLHATSKQS